jgi:hypothetical protein
MRVFWLVVILAVIGGGIYVFVFHKDWIMGKVEEGKRSLKGYTPAKTPGEVLDKFTKAIDERDYESAALYCDGDFAAELKKGAAAAKEMATAIDDLQDTMKKYNVKSDNATYVLLLIEPFPKKIKFDQVKHTEGEDKGSAVFIDDSPKPTEANIRDQWRIDFLMVRPFMRGWTGKIPVTLKTEGEGDKKEWRIHFPKNDQLRESVNHFKDKYSNYVNALNKLRKDTRNDPATKEGFEQELRYKLEASK